MRKEEADAILQDKEVPGVQKTPEPLKVQTIAERLTAEDNRLREAQAELDAINASLKMLDANIQGASPEAIQGQKSLLISKYNEAKKIWRKALLEAALANRWKPFRVLQNLKSGLPLQPWSPANPSGFTMDDIQKGIELSREVEAQADSGLAKSLKESEDLIKDMQSQIAQLNVDIESERKTMHDSMAASFDEAPLFVALNFPKVYSELIGELQGNTTQKPATPTATNSTATSTTEPSVAGKAESDPNNEAMNAAITEANILEAITQGKCSKFSNEDIWRYIRRKVNFPDMARIPQPQRSKIYRIRTEMLKSGKI